MNLLKNKQLIINISLSILILLIITFNIITKETKYTEPSVYYVESVYNIDNSSLCFTYNTIDKDNSRLNDSIYKIDIYSKEYITQRSSISIPSDFSLLESKTVVFNEETTFCIDNAHTNTIYLFTANGQYYTSDKRNSDVLKYTSGIMFQITIDTEGKSSKNWWICTSYFCNQTYLQD